MPRQQNETDEKVNEDIERASNYPCWEGYLHWRPIYERKNNKTNEVGRFSFCSRRLNPDPPENSDNKLNAIEKMKYRITGNMGCGVCRYEVSRKWENSIRISTKRKIVNEEEIIFPVSDLTRNDICTSIEKYIENGAQNDLIIEKSEKINIEELPF